LVYCALTHLPALYQAEVMMMKRYRNLSIGLFLVLLAALPAACTGATNPGAGGGSEAQVEEITLERQPCFGFCPVYTVSVGGDGQVAYNGIDFVDVTGAQTAAIDPAAVQALADEMIAAGYLEMEDAYMNQEVTDMPYAITSLALSDGTTKRIEHYYGDSTAPQALTDLEARIDEVANTAQWVGETGQ
jgi:hypothetical protein